MIATAVVDKPLFAAVAELAPHYDVCFGSLADIESGSAMRPLFPQKQTSLGSVGTSV